MELAAGAAFGPYRIVSPLGRGGMASVYRARDTALDRDVALKVLPQEFLHDPAFADRFKQEARVAAKLEHPHIVPVHAFGIEQGAPWMAMRLVTGGSLADRLRHGPIAPRQLAGLLREVAGALDYAHGRGVVHRDVKPANVLLDDGGRAYLADFGIARMLEGSSVATATGIIQGTPSYMAPEQAMGERVDRLADVYALGIVAFECLTGRVPYTGTTPVAVLMKHVQEPVPEPNPSEVAPPLAAVLRRSLAKTKTDRWASAGAFAEALSQAAAGVTPISISSLPTLDLPGDSDAETRTEKATKRPDEAKGAGDAKGRDDAKPLDEAERHDGAKPLNDRRPQDGANRRLWPILAAAGGLSLVLLGGAAGLLVMWRSGSGPSQVEPGPTGETPAPLVGRPSGPGPSPSAAAGGRAPRTAPSSGVTAEASPSETAKPSSGAAAEPSFASAATPSSRATAAGSSAPAPTVTPRSEHAAAPAHPGPFRVYLEAKLEPVMFQKTKAKDVADSLKDLREAIPKREGLELVDSRNLADAVVQVLERGREPAVIGVRKVRVRVLIGGESIELVGQDSMVTGFNTWSGAAGGAAKQVETWLARRQGNAGETR